MQSVAEGLESLGVGDKKGTESAREGKVEVDIERDEPGEEETETNEETENDGERKGAPVIVPTNKSLCI